MCNHCGSQDIMQKLSDAPLTECPKCKSTEFKKQVTSAGFNRELPRPKGLGFQLHWQ